MEVLKENKLKLKDFLNMVSKVESKTSFVGLIGGNKKKKLEFHSSKATIKFSSRWQAGTAASHLPENPCKRRRQREENLKQRRERQRAGRSLPGR